MTNLSELTSDQEFYFPFDRGTIYTVRGFVIRRDGTVKGVKTTTPGRIHPVYMSLKCSVILLTKYQKMLK